MRTKSQPASTLKGAMILNPIQAALTHSMQRLKVAEKELAAAQSQTEKLKNEIPKLRNTVAALRNQTAIRKQRKPKKAVKQMQAVLGEVFERPAFVIDAESEELPLPANVPGGDWK